MSKNREGLCPEKKDRRYCTQPVGHDGQCGYRIDGGQGGGHVAWWGANPRPVTWIGDYSHAKLGQEVARLRRLCEDHGVDWQADVTMPGW